MKPWESESNYEEFFYNGIECVIMRMPRIKCLYGFIGFEEGHSYYRKDITLEDLQVHGGITYTGMSLIDGTKSGKWWIGFDTAHTGDLIPLMCEKTPGYETFFRNGPVYRNLEYVRTEIKKLVDQVSR